MKTRTEFCMGVYLFSYIEPQLRHMYFGIVADYGRFGMKFVLPIVSTSAVLILLLAACGGGGGGPTLEPPTEPPAMPPTESPRESAVTALGRAATSTPMIGRRGVTQSLNTDSNNVTTDQVEAVFDRGRMTLRVTRQDGSTFELNSGEDALESLPGNPIRDNQVAYHWQLQRELGDGTTIMSGSFGEQPHRISLFVPSTPAETGEPTGFPCEIGRPAVPKSATRTSRLYCILGESECKLDWPFCRIALRRQYGQYSRTRLF